ncbi:MAG TPA: polyphenol oxidase family protein [Solirubrobacteraceae bacterium]|nr:polyphenol oxidase family protein [Solirubrobacteraceae bacterium]
MPAATATLPAPFTWAGDHVSAALPHGVRVAFTTRRGGVSRPPYDSLNLGRWTDDEPAAVEENRRRLLAALGLRRLAFGRQVHGAHVVRDAAEVLEADGQVTTEAGVGVMALTADCMAIALAAPGAAGMVHAGWRGLAGGVVEAAVEATGAVGAAAIGPCARGCCYEVGDEVRAALGVPAAGGPALVDLPALARERLAAAGVEQVHDTGLCTMCGDASLFFSHRRDGGRTGRQAGVAWR